MGRLREWNTIPARSLDRQVYGRVVCALRHRGGALLLHLKATSRNSRMYRRAGRWVVVIDREVVRTQSYYGGRPVTLPPTRWASRVLRLEVAGAFKAEIAKLLEMREGEAGGSEGDVTPRRRRDQLVWRPTTFDELPRSLAPMREYPRSRFRNLRFGKPRRGEWKFRRVAA